jgi:hypothetical protein
MEIKKLNPGTVLKDDKKGSEKWLQFEKLLAELQKREIPEEVVRMINVEVDKVNSAPNSPKELKKQLRISQSAILKYLEKELKLVPQNYYRNMWLAVGMAAFGIPIGTAFGASLGNMGLLSIGLPIGMVIGMAVGAGMDKKALEQGRQLDVEIK